MAHINLLSQQFRRWLFLTCAAVLSSGLQLFSATVQAQQRLIVAAYPAVDEIVKAAVPAWKKLRPTVEVQVVSRQFADHHTAMTTALSTSFYLPDVMALEVGYVGLSPTSSWALDFDSEARLLN